MTVDLEWPDDPPNDPSHGAVEDLLVEVIFPGLLADLGLVPLQVTLHPPPHLYNSLSPRQIGMVRTKKTQTIALVCYREPYLALPLSGLSFGKKIRFQVYANMPALIRQLPISSLSLFYIHLFYETRPSNKSHTYRILLTLERNKCR